MLTLLAQFGSEQVTFLVSSNEPVPKEELEDPSLRIAYCPGHELLDLYALAGCNYIAGPPSTYTMWASFYGNVPLYMIRDPHQAPLLNEFSIQESF